MTEEERLKIISYMARKYRPSDPDSYLGALWLVTKDEKNPKFIFKMCEFFFMSETSQRAKRYKVHERFLSRRSKSSSQNPLKLVDAQDEFENLMSKLESADAELLIEKFYVGKSTEEIAKDRSANRTTVCQQILRAVLKARRLIPKDLVNSF